jgi:hypothetical protein
MARRERGGITPVLVYCVARRLRLVCIAVLAAGYCSDRGLTVAFFRAQAVTRALEINL